MLFDLDGVLADSRLAITSCMNHALAEAGREPVPPESLYPLIGPSLSYGFASLLAVDPDDPEVAACIASYRAVYAEVSVRDTPTYPGVPEALAEIAAAVPGRRLAVATSKPGAYAAPLVTALGFGDTFDAVFAPELDLHVESKTTTVGKALAALGATGGTMVGDRHVDIDAAHAHGLRAVGVTWGFGTPRRAAHRRRRRPRRLARRPPRRRLGRDLHGGAGRLRAVPRFVVLAAVVIALLAGAVGATAMPGDPPSEPLAPADGASVPANPDGIPVSFTCPVYRTYDDGQGFKLFGGASDHGVSFSRSAAPGADGRLEEPVSLSTGERDGSAEGRCVSALGAGGASPRPQETPGTYFWQVWRRCTGCSGGYETGPVRRIVLRSTASLAIRRPVAPYAGFPRILKLELAGLPDGTATVVERKSGSRWRRAGSATALGEQGEAVVTLPRGRATLRVRATLGEETITSAPLVVVVRRGTRWSTVARDAGPYTGTAGGNRSVRLKVTRRGREVRDFEAFVAMTCPGVQPGQFTTQVGSAKIGKAKVDPDGRFVAAAKRSGSSMRIRGRVRNRRITEGRVELSVGACVGNSAYGARRR